jgi:hypothetical protein
MPFSFRLDPETRRRIAEMAEASGRSRSQLVREAVAAYEVSQRVKIVERNARQRLARFIGVARGGDPTLSRRTGATFRQLLEARRGRRSR